MEIKVQIFGCVYSLSVGRKTAWYESKNFICVTREWYGYDGQVSLAKMIFRI